MSRVYRHFSTAFWIICLSMRRDRPSPKAEAERGGGKKGLKDRGRDGLQLADVQGWKVGHLFLPEGGGVWGGRGGACFENRDYINAQTKPSNTARNKTEP